MENDITYGDFFLKAPSLNPNRKLIKGSVCGIKVEEITEPLMQEIRYLDKLVDELAKGKSMDKILPNRIEKKEINMKQNNNKNFPQQTHFLGVLIPEDITLTLEDGSK